MGQQTTKSKPNDKFNNLYANNSSTKRGTSHNLPRGRRAPNTQAKAPAEKKLMDKKPKKGLCRTYVDFFFVFGIITKKWVTFSQTKSSERALLEFSLSGFGHKNGVVLGNC